MSAKNKPVVRDREKIRHLRAGGSTLQEIANAIGVSRQRVHQLLKTDPSVARGTRRRFREDAGYRAASVVVDGARRADARSFEALVAWARRYRVFNVAGNSERTASGISASAEGLLRSLLAECR